MRSFSKISNLAAQAAMSFFFLLYCGCVMIPDYEDPKLDLPDYGLEAENFKYKANLWKDATPSDNLPKGDWWKVFGDETINKLIAECDKNNPDIAAAEREVYAANAQIGSDTAAFFPTISITGDVGFKANNIESLLEASSLAWGISPQVYIPIFQAGKLYAQKKSDLAAHKAATEKYKSAVLRAIAEVESALSDLGNMEREYENRKKTSTHAAEVQSYTQKQYELGLEDYFAVSDAQRQYLLYKREEIRLLGARYRTCVALVMALGGGWENRPEEISAFERLN